MLLGMRISYRASSSSLVSSKAGRRDALRRSCPGSSSSVIRLRCWMDLGHSDGSGNGIGRLFLLLVCRANTSQVTLRRLFCQCDDEAENIACIAAVLTVDINNILCEHVVKKRVGHALSLK